MSDFELLEDDFSPSEDNSSLGEQKNINKKEKSKKNDKEVKKVYAIINWFLELIPEDKVKNTDYAIHSKTWWDFVIYDLDKNKIRPYVLDMLRQMKIETLMSILVKIISFIVFIILIFCFIFFSKINWISKSVNSIIESNKNQNITNNI